MGANKKLAYANRLDPGQPKNKLVADLSFSLFAPKTIIPHQNASRFSRF